MIFLVLGLSFFALFPLFQSGFFSMHDFQQVTRLFELDKTLMGGSFPVRWTEGLGFGFGYPLFNFYPPFVYYLGEVFHLIGFGFIDSIKIVWGVALVGSALAMYFLAKEFFGKIGGVVAAVFYLYVPYHAVDAYVRGALAELFSFVWLPLILLFASRKKVITTGIFLGLLMITHNLIFLPFAGFYVLCVILINRQPLLYTFYFLLSTFAIAFALTAFFWLPSLAEKQFTLVDQFLTTGLANYQIHFVCPDQLWNSFWGYGGSIAGCLDGVSFKLGKPQLILALVTLGIGIWKKSRVPLVIFGLFGLAIFMTAEYSKFIWEKINLLWYLQFPWRFLEFAALFSALLAGGLFLIIRNFWLQLGLGVILIFGVIFLHGKYFAPQNYDYQATDTALTSDEEIRWKVSQTSFEYMAKGTAVKPTPQGSYTLDIVNYPTQKYLVTTGDFNADKIQFGADKFLLSGNSQTGAAIQFQIANFPGWKVWVDGQETVIDDNNKVKLITIAVPAGSHIVCWVFTNTPVRSLGNLISLSAIIGVGGYYLYARRRNKT